MAMLRPCHYIVASNVGYEMKVQTVSVTPAQAISWLKMNKFNRPVRTSYIKNLSEAMKRGEWAVTHQPIAINGTKLIDGQHRLMAVIASGLPSVKMSVAYDVEADTFDTIDIGIGRKNSDIFREDPAVMNPINYLGRLVIGKHTPREIRPIYEKTQKVMREIVGSCARNVRGFGAAPIRVGALAAILAGEDKKYVLNLYTKMSTFELDGLPRVAQIFVKQLSLGTVGRKVQSTERDQLMVRAFIAFQSANAGFERLSVKDMPSRLETVRKILRDALGIK